MAAPTTPTITLLNPHADRPNTNPTVRPAGRASVWFATGTVNLKKINGGNLTVKGHLLTGSGQSVQEAPTALISTKKKGDALVRRWVLRFALTDPLATPLTPGDYQLVIDGPPGVTAVDRIVTVAPSVIPPFDDPPFDIVYPDAPGDITDEAIAFVAWGTLTGDTSITSARMIPGNGAPVEAFVDEDWETDTWTAMFPALDPETYTLEVRDSVTPTADIETVNRLVVRQPGTPPLLGQQAARKAGSAKRPVSSRR
jgi:hypothetical protein